MGLPFEKKETQVNRVDDRIQIGILTQQEKGETLFYFCIQFDFFPQRILKNSSQIQLQSKRKYFPKELSIVEGKKENPSFSEDTQRKTIFSRQMEQFSEHTNTTAVNGKVESTWTKNVVKEVEEK